MAKFIQEYEYGVQKNKLVFRGKEFSFNMVKGEENGIVSSDKPCFSAQITVEFPDMTNAILSLGAVDMIDCNLYDEQIFEILEILEEQE